MSLPFKVSARATWLALGLFTATTCLTQAEIRLPKVFSNHMVLQQNSNVAVWGWADPGADVRVLLESPTSRSVSETKADDSGQWKVYLKTGSASFLSGTLVAGSGDDKVVVEDILLGEVWICSGQSNMQWAVSQTFEPQMAIAASTNPALRLLYVPRVKSNEPLNDIDATWTECNPDTVRGFSAVAYFFGLKLQQELNVPVGLIHTSWGGSPAEVWMDHETLSGNPMYKKEILDGHDQAMASYQSQLEAYEKAKSDAEAKGEKFEQRAPRGPYWTPSELYNAMIHPLLPFEIAGAIWYQGESNAGRAYQYRSLFPDMISNWRRAFGQGDFPFLLVQLASYMAIKDEPTDSSWAELREAQLLSTQVLPNVGMAVITDLGEEKDIHPRLKEPVGDRLAISALGIAYDKDVTYSGPTYKDMSVRRNSDGVRVSLKFDHVGGGLKVRGGSLIGFTICGPDRQFVKAHAKVVSGNTVHVWSDAVQNPVAVRYGWADYPLINLYNDAGLPASPFRTDSFPMITQPK